MPEILRPIIAGIKLPVLYNTGLGPKCGRNAIVCACDSWRFTIFTIDHSATYHVCSRYVGFTDISKEYVI